MNKINWKHVWSSQTKWFHTREERGGSYPSWEEQMRHIETLVERQLAAKKKSVKK